MAAFTPRVPAQDDGGGEVFPLLECDGVGGDDRDDGAGVRGCRGFDNLNIFRPRLEASSIAARA